ncbi:putative chromosome segregation in meiosis protein 3 [Rosellinia necatrix]|uniref:Chromosome segregation in meiosis protein n=1 Tax=Rosellinia necatrix TaxID=77044 RepID=A0A1W2TIK2_ROSNE|nr:putative chromosome segregation in meiosis protein 3 [Rosellinia necatrix]
MASRLISKPPQPPAKPINIDNYDIDDDDPFADSGDEAAKQSETAAAQSKKRKDASGLGIDEAVSVSKKPRVPRVKLDETRLLSDNGIPKLRSKAQNLRFKGKGHEFSDTARLLSFYQLWLDDLFPKAKFIDALSMVEKAGHKNQLRLKRIQWISEGQPKPAGLDDDDLFGDSNQPEGQERDPALFPAKLAPIFQSSLDKSTPAPTRDSPFAEEDIYGASPKRQTDAAPAITSLFGNGGNAQANDEPDEDDLDALMAEEEAQRTASTSIFGNGTTSTLGNGKTTLTVQTRHGLGNNDDDEDDLDALMAEAEADSLNTKHTKPVNARPSKRAIVDDNDDDDDLDALMAEAEAEGSAKKPPSHTPNTTGTKENGGVNHSIGEDEEAAMAEMEGLWE